MKHIKHINEFLFWNKKVQPEKDAKNLYKPIQWLVKSDDTKRLQDELVKMGFSLPRFGQDGILGPETLYGVESLIDVINRNKDLQNIVDTDDLDISNKTISPETQSVITQISNNTKVNDVLKKHFKEMYKIDDVDFYKRFEKTINTLITNVEGGFFTPLMFSDGRLKDDEKYHAKKGERSESGTTMMGIDFDNGKDVLNTDEGREFKKILNDADAIHKWPWNYYGGKDERKLRELVTKMMWYAYQRYTTKYLKPLSKEIVESDDRLLLHFCYALFNGEGFFRKYAREFNRLVEKGIVDTDILSKAVIDSRVNSNNGLIAQSGKKLQNMITQNQNTNIA